MAEPGIEPLDAADPVVAAEIHRVMMASYAVEAQVLGVDDFVPLRRTVERIRTSPTRFFGAAPAGRLAGVAEVDMSNPRGPNLDALVVHPEGFRTGLGSALVRHVIGQFGAAPLTVSTGERNAPAIALYEKLGFAIERRWRTPDGIPMVTLLRPVSA